MSPSEDAINKIPEPLICAYPGLATQIPNEVFDDTVFQLELANSLSRLNAVDSHFHSPPPSDPKYINALFNDLLCGVNSVLLHVTGRAILPPIQHRVDHSADITRITKHVRDYVGRSWMIQGATKDVWRRSPLWLLIRVAIQMSVEPGLGRGSYKCFILFFTCTLATGESNRDLSSDLLHLMSSQILRRLRKLGPSVPDWLSEMALKTCTCLLEILDARWKELGNRLYPFRNPSRDELARDTQLSLPNSHEYIQNALTNPGHAVVDTPFHPSHPRRGILEDFLSSNGTYFDEAYDIDPDIALYDVEQSVERGIDDWLARVTNVDEACEQLEILMDKYMTKAYTRKDSEKNPEDLSIRLLTGIELYVALDKLVVKEVPMLADYPPEIPTAFLERLLLRKTTNLHRLSCAYQYLSGRYSRSCPGWSVLSDAEFTKDSFPVRYYDQSPDLQHLKARIESEEAMRKDAGGVGSQQRPDSEFAQLLLPVLPLHAKVVVFELQCPACIRIWRSAAPRILHHFYYHIFDNDSDPFNVDDDPNWPEFLRHIYRLIFDPRSVNTDEKHCLLARIPRLQPYFLERQGPPIRVQIHLAYFHPEKFLVGFRSRNHPILRYVVQHPHAHDDTLGDSLSVWRPQWCYSDGELSFNLRYQHTCVGLKKYVNYTSHTSNDVLSAQMDCPKDFSLGEFITFGHLRSGGALQWLNILQALRSRTLNFHHLQVHYLLANAAFQVGPLDLNTGTWIWHQELQDSSFCNALLYELENLFVDVGVGSMDGVIMHTISLLLARVLASSPSKDVSDRAIALLRSVRRTTFSWVQDLSYDLTKAPTNEGCRKLLLDMAATCRSTFDVGPDPVTVRKLCHSAEDVDALLSCAFFIHTLGTSNS